MGTGRSFASDGKASVNLSFHTVAVVGTVRSGVPTVGLVQLKRAQGRRTYRHLLLSIVTGLLSIQTSASRNQSEVLCFWFECVCINFGPTLTHCRVTTARYC